MITIILNTYKRTKYLNKQLKAIKKQSVKVNEILIWQNKYYGKKNKQKDIIFASSNYNFGVWARFAFALNSKSEFVCILDDDTIPGKNWLKNCLRTIEKKKWSSWI
tara:strand:+ start:1101 stop:1418 length:318 start_codon:yes stop_codon:yes gene_type:complete